MQFPIYLAQVTNISVRFPSNPKKYRGNPTQVVYRSLWERKLMVYCDKNEKVLEWGREEVIIPYGSGSKISCDSTGNYFNLFMDGLQAERNYRFCVKVVSGSGTTDEQINFYDDNYEFRVVR